MKIKKFEAFNHRVPEEVSQGECQRKYEIHDPESFTQKEIDFFNKIGKDYRLDFYPENWDISDSNCVQFISDPEGDEVIAIQIIKLKDDWYLIYDDTYQLISRYFVCDEWDEVLGYFENNKTHLEPRFFYYGYSN
jgi:hypothetical protein